jgi:hypothetical protein
MEDERNYWQPIWRRLCEMSFYGVYIQKEFVIPPRKIVYSDIFFECTLDHEYRRISTRLDSLGMYIEPRIIPELVYIKAPKVLFEHLGVYSWFKYSFPNCKIELW